jgi:glycosyltransferase involved in cell wall biosynthesis
VLGQLLRRTAERHTVGVVYLQHETEPPPDEEVLRRLDLAEAVDRPTGARTSPGHYLRAARWRAGLLAGTPRHASELSFRAARARIRDVVRAWEPDVIRIEYPVMAAHLPALEGSGAARVLAEYDAFLETAHVARGPLDRLEHRLDVRAWARFRRRALERVDAAVVFTERDRAALAALSVGREIVRVPMGLELDVPAANPAGMEPAELLFVGNFNHVPNADAALHLVGEILPRIRKRRPEALLRLVGERPPPSAVGPGVEATGRVPEVLPYLDAAAMVVAPLRLGGGTRVKVLEALAAGKALVAYPPALEGVDVEPGRHALVADGPKAFAAAVCALLDDPARRVALGKAARVWAKENLGWERPLAAYDELYARLVARR